MTLIDCFTQREIFHQPRMWMETYDVVFSKRNEIRRFLEINKIEKDTEIVLTGAGTSAFIADTAVCLFERSGYRNARSISTTDIVSAPEFFLTPGKKLFISFGRSGDSPESVAAYKIARELCNGASHLIITCNPQGYLARTADKDLDYVIVLPEGTNDRSLAMTSSFSSMLVASLLCMNLDNIEAERVKLQAAADFAECFLSDEALSQIKSLTSRKISRAVFLGSGALKGVACECHLKLQELTDGQLMCSFDSFMGLRHGPKAVINDETLVVYLLSEDPYTRRYELDLVEQVGLQHNPAGQVIVSTVPSGYKGKGIDFEISAEPSDALLAGDYKYVPYVMIGQILGYFFSLSKGLNPDTPSISGTISRVVSGVKIYDYQR